MDFPFSAPFNWSSHLYRKRNKRKLLQGSKKRIVVRFRKMKRTRAPRNCYRNLGNT